MRERRQKSVLARKLEYWFRQTKRIIWLLIGIFVVIIVVIALLWIIPILIEFIKNLF